jgi:hypothetical protein
MPSRLTTANMSREWSKNQRAAADSARFALVVRFPVLPPAIRGYPLSYLPGTMQGDL